EQVRRQAPAAARVLVLPAAPDRDQELRQALRLYHYDWPVVVGAGTPESLGLRPPAALLVARDGLAGVTVPAPFGSNLGAALGAGAALVVAREGVGGVRVPAPLGSTLGAVLGALAMEDAREVRPRPQPRQRVPEPLPPPRPGFLPEGIAPGEDGPAPKEFTD